MPAADSRESERRHVSVMFADVSGFTAISRTMDPEDVTDLMNACFAILERVVIDHGGHVDKYIGDCVMALFGAPSAIEDAPRQAVNASICILERIAEFARQRGISDLVDVHVGINTGLVVYGDVGGDASRDTTAMGDTVNIASRLRDASGVQCIYVGAQTRHETVNDFQYRPVHGLRLKGVSGRYDAWEVLSRQPRLHRAIAGEFRPESLSPLVGREAAFLQLERAVGQLFSGRGGIVAITGEAGLGKSRLLLEMRRSPPMANACCMEGRAFRIDDSPGLQAFADMLRSWAGLAGYEAKDARERMNAALREAVGDRTPELYPFLATMAGLPMLSMDILRVEGIDSEGMQRLITHSVRELLERLSGRAPLLLMFDDLHWADQSTLDLLLRILDLVQRHPVLFAVAFRPDPDLPSAAFLAAVRERHAGFLTEIQLEPLDAKASGALLRDRIRFDDRPDQTRRTILSHAEGNPFFMEEIIRSFIDTGAIRETSGGLRVTKHLSDVQVPGTVQELMMERVDRLRAVVRDVLQWAAVVGRTFSVKILEAVSGREGLLDEALSELSRRCFLVPLAAGAGGEYAFQHALAHETVYETILRRRRREMHLAVGSSIETVYAGRLHEHYASLAYHFCRAEEWNKASFYLLKAGDEAARSAASSEALRYFAEAAIIHDRLHGERSKPAERAAIEKKIGLACLARGDLPQALDHIDRALALLGYSTPDTRPQMLWRVGTDLLAIGWHLSVGRRVTSRREPPARIVEITELCFHKGKAQSTTAPQGYVMSMLPAIRAVGAWDFRRVDHACGVYSAGAALFAWSGLSFRIARRMSRAGSELVRTVPDAVIHGTMRFVALYLEGDWAEANTLPESLVDNGLRYGAFWEVNTYLGMHCECRIQQGRLVEAAAVIRRIAEIGERYGYGFSSTNVHAMRMFLLLQAGQLDLALAEASRYYDVCNEEALNLLALATRARILLAAGDRAAAATALANAEILARVLGRQAAPYHLAPLRLARLEHDILELEDAIARRSDAASLRRRAAKSRRMALSVVAAIARDRPACFRAVARLEWACGKPRAALRWWRQAMHESASLGALPEFARASRECGERLLAAGRAGEQVDGVTAQALVERAAAIETRLEDEWGRIAAQEKPEQPRV